VFTLRIERIDSRGTWMFMDVPHGGKAMTGRKLRFDAPETDTASDSVSALTVAALRRAANPLPDEPDAELPANDSVSIESASAEPHALERAIQLELLNQSDVRFSSLVVHRIPDGVCLQGVIEIDNDLPDIERITRELSGVNRVMNHLVVRRRASNA